MGFVPCESFQTLYVDSSDKKQDLSIQLNCLTWLRCTVGRGFIFVAGCLELGAAVDIYIYIFISSDFAGDPKETKAMVLSVSSTAVYNTVGPLSYQATSLKV